MPSGKFIRTEAHKRNISDALTGRKLSAEHAANMGKTKIGNKYMLGKHHTEASKEKMSEGHTGDKHSLEHRKKITETKRFRGIRSPMLGKTHTLVTREKMSRSHRGPNHHFWRGGITPLRRAIRNSWEYTQWRSAGFLRDNYLCVIGGKDHGHKLHYDHIKRFSDILIENNITTMDEAMNCSALWDINNGRTLCEKCHRGTDTWGQKKQWNSKII